MYYCRQWNGVLSRTVCKGEQWCHYLWLSSISPFTSYFAMGDVPELAMGCCLVGVLASALKRNVILFLTFLTFWVVFGIWMCSTWCMPKLSNTCAIWGYHSSADEDSSLLGYCTVSSGNDLSSRFQTPASHTLIYSDTHTPFIQSLRCSVLECLKITRLRNVSPLSRKFIAVLTKSRRWTVFWIGTPTFCPQRSGMLHVPSHYC